jgi:colanic acid/amylovoran biosynthesis protein
MNTATQFLFVGNGSYLNRGCEAITRGTARILKSAFGEDTLCLNANQELLPLEALPVDGTIHCPVYAPSSRLSGRLRNGARRILPNRLYRRLCNRALIPLVQRSRATLSVGGDNFTIDYGIPYSHLEQNRFVLDMGKPLVVWGASIGPFDASPKLASLFHRHLRDEVTAIFVREPESREYLARHGIERNVHFAYDPAFAMLPEPVDDRTLGFAMPADAIGLNISPFITAQAHISRADSPAWVTALVLQLRKVTGRPIVLIPHVTVPWRDDHALLQAALALCPDRSGLFLVPPSLNAAQLKSVISRLGGLVAGRTHATIAAFSTAVPTISLVYSTKAVGLNKLIFGHTDYAVPADRITSDNIVSAAMRCLADDKPIRDWLKSRQAGFQASALGAGTALRQLLT